MDASENTTQQNGRLGEALLSDRALAAWEIGSIVSSVFIAEWIGAVTTEWTKLALAIPIGLAFVLTIGSHRLRGESLRELGFRFDNFFRAGGLLLLPMILIAIACLAIGWRSGEGVDVSRWHVSRPIGVQLLLGFVWGFIQQYMLQSFVNRRAQIIWGKGFPGILLVAFVFAGLHLPNPWLTAITFLGGLVWAFVYQRAPNILALAVSHAVMTWILVSTLPASALNHLRIGLKYFD